MTLELLFLAAGNSSRFGDENKLIAKFGKKTVIELRSITLQNHSKKVK